jgi:FkbM family methyltransferase
VIPSAQRFYAQFVNPGDTVFDIGANLGNRTETFVALGARVVAVEPQAELAQQLRERYAGNSNVTVLDCALSDSAGEAEMLISDAHTLSTMATEWPEKVKSSGRFAENSWNEKRIVKTRTLASLIEEHGAPVFCKIDVEGFEATVLAGLDRPVTACSLEFASENLDGLGACLERLASLGPVECNYSVGESMEFARPDWVSAEDLLAELAALPGELPWGDVYVRSRTRAPSFIAFSKDRPAQLELLLRSMARFAPDTDVAVVYTASDELYDRGYAIVRDDYPSVRWADEREDGGFKAATLKFAHAAGPRLAFLVDDIVFTHPLELGAPGLRALDEDPAVLCCSLRLDSNKTYCYALDRTTPVPLDAGSTTWEWRGQDGDWGYPMSADGHVFRSEQIVPLLERLDYHNPNALEEQLSLNPIDLPRMTCVNPSRLVNVPDNRVQDTAPNRHAGNDPRELAEAFGAGRRLDLAPFDGLVTDAVHHEMPLALEGPRVSVVIPCHNMADTLAETVASVRASAFDGEIEVIVVDDGSTDASADLARELGVTLLSQPASGHPAHARNAGFAAAAAPYVLPLDADDRVDHAFLAATVTALDANPGAGFAYGDELDFGAGDDVLHRTPAYDFAALTHKNFLGSATLVRRAAFEAVGGYDAELGYEDWDLWIALGNAGWHGVKADGAVFEHRVSDGRWAFDIGRDRETKARFVLKRPELYSDAQRQWAAGVLEGDAVALATPDEVGIIPASAPLAAPAQIDAKAHAIAAAADELAADPELLRAYGRAFGPDDDVTLVIYGDSTPEHIAGILEPAIAAAGLARPDAPDLLAVPGPAPVAETVALRASAVLSRGSAPAQWNELPRFDDANVGELRRTLLGDDFEVPADMAWAFGADGFYEQDVTEWFDRLMERVTPEVVYDIGANCGWFAVRADRAGAAVRAFEPVPNTADVLERNLRRARDARVTRAAVGAEPGTALMHLYSSSGNNSLVERSLPPGHPLRHEGRHEVEILTLDDLVGTDGFPAPGLVKIDVEGYELPVLQGARKTLREHQPPLLLEWSETTCRDAGYDRDELVTELRDLGYTVHAIDAGRLVAPESAGPEAETLIAAPDSLEIERPAVRAPLPSELPLDPQQRFRTELEIYRSMDGAGDVLEQDLNPQLDDRTPTTPFDQHYFYQDIWAARRVAEIRPGRHVDVGSRVDYVGFLTAICPVTFVDIRPLEVDIEDFESLAGSILDMPFPDHSLESISCLHVAEHIGLGRYGDPLDPLGTRKAAAELQRVLAPGGSLLFSGPVGRGRTCFNAHRVHDVDAVVEEFFPELELVEFSGVDDRAVFRRHRELAELRGSNYACGMYHFKRPA